MWICLNDSFLSIVAHRKYPAVLLVRARRKDHITNAFPGAPVFEDPKADYRFRANIARPLVIEALTSRLEHIKYDNFKDSVEDDDLHDAYLKVWSTMHRLQP